MSPRHCNICFFLPISLYIWSTLSTYAFPFLIGEGHFQICVHELRPLSRYATGSEPQWLLYVGHGKPKTRLRQAHRQRWQLLISGLSRYVPHKSLPRLHTHWITGVYSFNKYWENFSCGNKWAASSVNQAWTKAFLLVCKISCITTANVTAHQLNISRLLIFCVTVRVS